MNSHAYPEYQQTNDCGLGDLPVHWKKCRLAYTLDLLVDGTHHSPTSWPEGDYKYVTAKNIKESGFDFSDLSYISASDHNEIYSRCPVRKNDVLYIKDGATAGIAMLNNLEEPFSLLSSVAVIRPNPKFFLPSFVTYHLNAGQFKNFLLQSLVGGAMTRFTLDMIGRFVLATPPLPEQQAIAAFLDVETSKIDALVAEQRRLIELLKEKRQAVISHAVTKGLNPHVKMKPSGIDWLGDVPEHWEVMKLGFVTLLRCDGPFGSGLKSEHYSEAGVRVIRLNNIRMGYFDNADWAFISPEYYHSELRGGHDVVEGDLLIAGLGDENNPVGRTCVAPNEIEPAMVKADCFRFRVKKERVLPAFVSYQLNVSAKADAGVMSTGTTRSRMPLSIMSRRTISFPSLAEQKEIVEYLGEFEANSWALQMEAEKVVSILQERRTALISAAVTGKIDVRGFVPKEASA